MPHPKTVAQAKIYLDCRKLIDILLDIIPQFPRDFKYAFGAKMQDISVNLIRHIAAAYQSMNAVEKARHLMAFKAEFETLKLLVRIAGERKWIKGIHKYAAIVAIMTEIGKQSSAWKNKVGF